MLVASKVTITWLSLPTSTWTGLLDEGRWIQSSSWAVGGRGQTARQRSEQTTFRDLGTSGHLRPAMSFLHNRTLVPSLIIFRFVNKTVHFLFQTNTWTIPPTDRTKFIHLKKLLSNHIVTCWLLFGWSFKDHDIIRMTTNRVINSHETNPLTF